MASTTFRRASEQTGAPLLFGLEISFSSFSSLLRSSTSQVVCPRSLQAFGSPVLIYAPLRSRNEAYDVLSRVFVSGLSITQKPRVSSDPLHKDRHTYPQTFSTIVQNCEAHGNVSIFLRASLQSSMQNLW